MDENLQKILEKKYKVVWRDANEYLDVINKVSISDPYLQKKFSSYLPNDDPLYYTFGYKPLIEVATQKPNSQNLLQNRGTETKSHDLIIFVIPKSEFLFKGMKTFYREGQLTTSGGPRWFGEETIAFKYAKRYHGGINVYQPKADLKLLVFSNYLNMKKIIQYYQMKDKKIAYMIKIKTGVDISIFNQIDYYLKYNVYDSIWLARKPVISPVSGNLTPVISGFNSWGRGKIDRIVGAAICSYCVAHGLDGYISYENFSPFFAYSSEEVVLCDYSRVLVRDPRHPLDWLSWEKYLPIVIEPNFLLEESFSSKNNNFQIIKFWNYNKMDSKQNKSICLKIKSLAENFVLMTLNVHSFYSVNHYNSAKDFFKKFLLLMKNFRVDLACVQEFKIDDQLQMKYIERKLQKASYHITFTPCIRNFGNAIISRFNIKMEEEMKLKNENFKMVRKATFFRIERNQVEHLLFCLTHLEIGHRYTARTGGLLPEEDLVKLMKINSTVRTNQLKQIIEKKPDIILGDFNFNPDDPEFQFLTGSYDVFLEKITSTNPFGGITDYICYRRESGIKPQLSVVLNYRYSDHLPVLNVI